MKSIGKLLNQEGFLKTLFDSIPCGVLIVDSDRRINAVNNVMERTFGISSAEVIDKRGGEALRCIHASESPKGCGFADECQSCQVFNTALEALNGKQTKKSKANLQLLTNGKTLDISLLVSAAPLYHEDEMLAIILLENIAELNTPSGRLETEQGFAGIIGRDAGMNEVFETIKQVAEVSVPVIIQGESGTGKELVAVAIHNESPRAKKPFVPINCGALPEGLLESELFGHVKGSFTGALRDKKGRFELAHGGTLFLDEVVDLPKFLQSKLLRVLQEGTIDRVGGEKTISVDVRIISAANRDLKKEVQKGNFREDLYYRIKVVPIHLPPLRKRKNDIPLLVNHFLKRIVKNRGKDSVNISHKSMALMMHYHWPGNVRELENAIQFAIVKCSGGNILPNDLPMEIRDLAGLSPSRGPSKKLDIDRARLALKQTGGNKAKAARLLGVGRATLYRFLADFPEAMQDNK